MKLNINDYVKVKLTAHGKAILKQQHKEFVAAYPKIGYKFNLPEETDGWSRWQLWSLMETFGSSMGLGCKMPFETIIDIVEAE